MRISHAEYLAMQARIDASRKTICENLEAPKSSQREVGKGGIQDEIEAWLKTQAHRCWWTVSRTDKATTNRVGTPDFVGVFCGVAFGIEAKRPGKKPTVDQLGELMWMRKAGARTAVVYSKDEAVEFLTSLLPEEFK
jgi:hypothetical protein